MDLSACRLQQVPSIVLTVHFVWVNHLNNMQLKCSGLDYLFIFFLCSKEGGQALLGRPTEVPHFWPPGSLLPLTQLQSYWATGHQRHKELENCRNLEIQSDQDSVMLPALYNHICTIVQANLLASLMLIALGVKPVCSQHYSFTFKHYSTS